MYDDSVAVTVLSDISGLLPYVCIGGIWRLTHIHIKYIEEDSGVLVLLDTHSTFSGGSGWAAIGWGGGCGLDLLFTESLLVEEDGCALHGLLTVVLPVEEVEHGYQ